MKANIKIVTEIKEISELLKFAKQNFIVGEKQVFSQKEIKSDKLYYFDEKLLTSQEALSNLFFLVLKTDNKIAG